MTSAPTLVLERLKTEFPQYAARGDQARSVAREIFHSERLVWVNFCIEVCPRYVNK